MNIKSILLHCVWTTIAVGAGILFSAGLYRIGNLLHVAVARDYRDSMHVSAFTSPIPEREQDTTSPVVIDTDYLQPSIPDDWHEELERIDREYQEWLLNESRKVKQVIETGTVGLKYLKEAFVMQQLPGQPDWFPENLHITIDDGPMIADQSLPNILNVLQRFGVKATFFIVGVHLERNYAALPEKTNLLLNRILAEGHQIGYHSYEHIHAGSRRLDKQEKEIIVADIKKLQDLITQILGRPFAFSVGRMPGGNGTFNKNVTEAFEESGLEHPKSWSINTELWEEAVRGNSIERYIRGLLARRDNYIILLHERPGIAKNLDRFLTTLKNMSLKDR